MNRKITYSAVHAEKDTLKNTMLWVFTFTRLRQKWAQSKAGGKRTKGNPGLQVSHTSRQFITNATWEPSSQTQKSTKANGKAHLLETQMSNVTAGSVLKDQKPLMMSTTRSTKNTLIRTPSSPGTGSSWTIWMGYCKSSQTSTTSRRRQRDRVPLTIANSFLYWWRRLATSWRKPAKSNFAHNLDWNCWTKALNTLRSTWPRGGTYCTSSFALACLPTLTTSINKRKRSIWKWSTIWSWLSSKRRKNSTFTLH